MQGNLAGKRIAILATDGFEQSELTEPRDALTEVGAEVEIVSLRPGRIQGMKHKEKGDQVPVSALVADCRARDYDGLVLPGGLSNPDEMRTHPEAVLFVTDFFRLGKPVGAICHGLWMLVEADVVSGRTLTSWPSLMTDLRNAGADWVDREVVLDDNLVTSRKPSDLPAFCRKFIMLVGAGEDDEMEEEEDNYEEARRLSDMNRSLTREDLDEASKQLERMMRSGKPH